jgi:hypothetical protein
LMICLPLFCSVLLSLEIKSIRVSFSKWENRHFFRIERASVAYHHWLWEKEQMSGLCFGYDVCMRWTAAPQGGPSCISWPTSGPCLWENWWALQPSYEAASWSITVQLNSGICSMGGLWILKSFFPCGHLPILFWSDSRDIRVSHICDLSDQ